jgi:hypothetical protein
MVLECTFLNQTGDVHPTIQNFLFQIETISTYFCHSKSNVVICELEEDHSKGMESMGYPIAPSQPPFDFWSQMDQMRYGFPSLSQSEAMGYGMGGCDL